MVLHDYHRADSAEYVKSGKKLAAETIETLTVYFQSLFAQRQNNGVLERAEVDCICNHPKQTLASDLRDKLEACRTNDVRCEYASADNTMAIVHMIVVPMIDVAITAEDWDTTDTTTSQNTETALA